MSSWVSALHVTHLGGAGKVFPVERWSRRNTRAVQPAPTLQTAKPSVPVKTGERQPVDLVESGNVEPPPAIRPLRDDGAHLSLDKARS